MEINELRELHNSNKTPIKALNEIGKLIGEYIMEELAKENK